MFALSKNSFVDACCNLRKVVRRGFRRSAHGNMTLMFALSLPAMFAGIGVASDYAILEMKRSNLQAAADAAALAAAKELSIASSTDLGIVAAGQNYVANALREGDTTAVTSVTLNRKAGSVTVGLSEAWTPFFAHFLNAGVTPVTVSSTAMMAGTANICVLTLHPSSNRALFMDKSALLSANGCGVYSNSKHTNGIRVDQSAILTSVLTCSVGGIMVKNSGSVIPAGLTNCPPVADPLAGRVPPPIGACTYKNKVVSSGTVALLPGHYCGGLKVSGTAQVTLAPGTYVISDGPLEVSGNATFTGDHVGFYLDGEDSQLNLTGNSTISLTGAVNAEMAGLLFFENPNASSDHKHHIDAANAQTLTGTIYMPKGYLSIDPNGQVAEKSAYTAIIVSRLELSMGPELVLNSDYGATDVPVPAGIKTSATVVLAN